VREAQETFFTCRALKTQGDQVFHQVNATVKDFAVLFKFDRIGQKMRKVFHLGYGEEAI
jgi:hypothetical protein